MMYLELSHYARKVWADNCSQDQLKFSTRPSHLDQLERIESFVLNCVSEEIPTYAYYWMSAQKGLPDALTFLRNFEILKFNLTHLPNEYVYSVRVQVCLEVFRELGINDIVWTDPKLKLSWDNPNQIGLAQLPQFQGEMLDLLVLLVREKMKSATVNQQIAQRKQQAKNNSDAAIRLIKNCTDLKIPLYVLRMDLGYRSDYANNCPTPITASSLTQIKKDWLTFTKRISNIKDYRGIIGHIAKLEYNDSRGHSFHGIFLCRHDDLYREDHWLKLIGNLWLNVAGDDGRYFNCNYDGVVPLSTDGVGVICEEDKHKKRILEDWVVGYIALSSEYLKVKVPAKVSVFSKGFNTKAKTDTVNSLQQNGIDSYTNRLHRTQQKPFNETASIYQDIALFRSSYDTEWNFKVATNQNLLIDAELFNKIESIVDIMINDVRPAYYNPFNSKNPITTITPVGTQLKELINITFMGEIADSNYNNFHSLFRSIDSLSVNSKLFYLALKSLSKDINSVNRQVGHKHSEQQKESITINLLNQFVAFIKYCFMEDVKIIQPSEKSKLRYLCNKATRNKILNELRQKIKPYSEVVKNLAILKRDSDNVSVSEPPSKVKTVLQLINQRNKASNQNFEKVYNFVKPVLEKDIIAICLDFGIRVDYVESPLPHTVYSLIWRRFIQKGVLSQRPLSSMLRCIGKWEYSPNKGVYAHVIFFMDATKVSELSGLAESIRDYWDCMINEVLQQKPLIKDFEWTDRTRLTGCVHRSLMTSDQAILTDYICQINHNDSQAHKALKDRVVAYIAKSSLYYNYPAPSISPWMIKAINKNPTTTRQSIIPINYVSTSHLNKQSDTNSVSLEDAKKSTTEDLQIPNSFDNTNASGSAKQDIYILYGNGTHSSFGTNPTRIRVRPK
jgi:hypothetical protein